MSGLVLVEVAKKLQHVIVQLKKKFFILAGLMLMSCSSVAKEQSTSVESPKVPAAAQAKFRTFKTDLTRTSIDFDKILSGGPPKGGIPALTKPAFVSIKETSLKDEISGIFVDLKGDQRYYPFNILVWHEIVNDTVGGEPVAITFCPLCASAIVFDRNVNGDILEFHVSGFLYESNLLMYDTKTESLWSQVRNEAVVGTYTGTLLKLVPMQQLSFGELKKKHPKAKVLSEKTGYKRDYSFYPYGDYEESEDLYFPISIEDNRFHPKEIMLVVPVNKMSVVFPLKELVDGASIQVNKKKLTIKRSGEEFTATYGEKTLPFYYEMWFSWVTQHEKDGLVWRGRP